MSIDLLRNIRRRPTAVLLRRLTIVLLALLTYACSADSKKKTSKKVGASPPDTISTWTAGIVHDSTRIPSDTFSVVEDVRAGRHDGFDRTVFEFSGPGIPGFHIEYVDKPVYECGSGRPIELEGDGWLMIKFLSARMHREGRSTIPQRIVKPRLPVLLRLTTSCDFENYVTWIASLETPNRFQVLSLENPPRLVVDIRH